MSRWKKHLISLCWTELYFICKNHLGYEDSVSAEWLIQNRMGHSDTLPSLFSFLPHFLPSKLFVLAPNASVYADEAAVKNKLVSVFKWSENTSRSSEVFKIGGPKHRHRLNLRSKFSW